MRNLLGVVALAALGLGAGACSDPDARVQSYDFGPYTIAPSQERTKDCVQISLNNDEPLFVNTVELTTGPGFHHSNWLFVPEDIFAGPDGTFVCNDRQYSEVVAAAFGGVLFAQSTQSQHEVQAFAPSTAVRLPARTKLVTQLHLLNASEVELTAHPNLKITSIPEEHVEIALSGMSFQNQALALPAGKQSRFSVECELADRHRKELDRDPDFHIYYGLGHYHDLGMGVTLDAIRPDGSSANVFTTSGRVGDSLGGPIAPTFDMSGFSKLRMTCDFYNPRSDVVRWGVGDQEMCVLLAFTDSPFIWGGGVMSRQEPANETQVGNVMAYSNPCQLIALPSH